MIVCGLVRARLLLREENLGSVQTMLEKLENVLPRIYRIISCCCCNWKRSFISTVTSTFLTNPSRKWRLSKTITSRKSCDFPVRVFNKHKAEMAADCCVFKIIPRGVHVVWTENNRCVFQSEDVILKFLQSCTTSLTPTGLVKDTKWLPPFHLFGISIWLFWRRMRTLYN